MYRLQTLARSIQFEISITKHKLQILGNIGKLSLFGQNIHYRLKGTFGDSSSFDMEKTLNHSGIKIDTTKY